LSSIVTGQIMENHQLKITAHIAVIVPAYKVEKQVQRVLLNIPSFVRTIIVVDDASPDATAAIVQSVNDPRIIYIRHKKNKGVGAAMKTGYQRAIEEGAEILVKMDGDDQMDPHQIVNLLKPIIKGSADFVKGNRFFHQAQLEKMPIIRRVGNWLLTFLVKAASGYWHVFDPSNGFTAVHASVWRLVNQDRISNDYFFESSLLIELRFLSAVVKDIAIPARYQDEQSLLSISKVLFSFPFRLVKAFFHRLLFQYYLYNFSFSSLAFLAGALFLLFGLVWGGWHWHESIKTQIPATTGTVLIAVLPVIFCMQLWIQAIAQDILDTPKEPIHPSLNE